MLNEEKIIQGYILAEARVVAMFPYRYVIDEMYDYVEKMVNKYVSSAFERMKYSVHNFITNPKDLKGNKLSDSCNEFWLPKNIVSKMDFAKDLKVHIVFEAYDDGSITDRENGKYIFGSGGTYIPSEARLTKDGKLDCGIIEIHCLYNPKNNNLLKKSTYNNLYHEFNHMYLAWRQLKDNEKFSDTSSFREGNKVIGQAKLQEFAFPKDKDDFRAKYLFYLIYRLFNYDETNALIASVYGDLKQCYKVEDNRPDFKSSLHKTQAYSEYIYLKDNKNEFVNSLNYEEIELIRFLFKKVNISIRMYGNDFKLSLKNAIDFALENLLHRICRTISLYYDEVQDIQEYKKSINLNRL